MKKIFLLFAFVFSAVLFFGCSLFQSSGDVLSLKFLVSDESAPEGYYAEAVLSFVPDYELRTVSVNYTLDFPSDEGELPDSRNIDSEGVIGGEYFERFERIISALDPEVVGVNTSDSAENFTVVLEKKNGVLEEYDLAFVDDESLIELLSVYYLDVVELFTEEVY
jgi:hypothetical protein